MAFFVYSKHQSGCIIMDLSRSAIKIHSILSELNNLRNSTAHPKTDFNKNQIASPWSHGPSTQTSHLSTQDGHPHGFGSRGPVI